MSLEWSEIAECVIAQAPADDRAASVIYLDERILPAGAELEIDYKKTRLDSPAAVGFIDLQPEMNWGHECRYVLVDPESGTSRTIDAHFPPFLRGTPPTLRVLWKGEHVPDWAVQTPTESD